MPNQSLASVRIHGKLRWAAMLFAQREKHPKNIKLFAVLVIPILLMFWNASYAVAAGIEQSKLTRLFINAISNDEVVDFDRICKNGDSLLSLTNDSCHQIDPALFKKIIFDQEIGPLLVSHRLEIAHAVFDGDLDLTHTNIPGRVAIENSRFFGVLSLKRASLGGDFLLSRDTFYNGLNATGVIANGLFDVEQSDFNGGAIDISASKFSLDVRITNNRIFCCSTFSIEGAEFAKNLLFSGNQLYSTLDAQSLRVLRDFKLQNNKFYEVNFSSMHIGGEFTIYSDQYIKELNLSEIHVEGSLEMDDANAFRSDVDMHNSKVDGDIIIGHSVFFGNFDAVRIAVGGGFYLGSGAALDGQLVDMHQAKIAGDLSIGSERQDVRVVGLFKLGLSHTTNIFLHNALFVGTLDFTGVQVDGHFDLGNSTLTEVELSRANIAGDLRVAHAKRNQCARWIGGGHLNVRYAHIGVLQDDEAELKKDCWPAALDLQGLIYDHFGSKRDSNWALDWLSKDNSQPSASYSQMALLFKSEEHLNFGDDILYAEKNHEFYVAEKTCSKNRIGSCVRAALLGLYKVIAGYGIEHRAYIVLYWTIGAITLGSIVLCASESARSKGGGFGFLGLASTSFSQLST